MQRQYRDYLSDFKAWDQKLHAKQWMLFSKNLGSHLSLDETAFSNGDLYTILTNKKAKGKKGAIVAMIKGTKAENVIKILHKISLKQRKTPEILPNGDTLKQLLARSRYLLYKSSSKWTENQLKRAGILFSRYPDLEKAYNLCQNLSAIFNTTKDKTSALIRLAKWDEKVRQAAFKSFNTIARTMSIHYKNILNYFDNRSTNASAESFNAKIKAFRAQFRGVRNIEFFLFRLSNIFA